MNKKEIVIKALTAPPWRGQTLRTAVFASAMLFASSTLFAQVKIGTNPTTIDANNNLEVESATVGNKVFIKKSGKVTISDGSQGNNKILTSDANGEATWKLADAQNSPVQVKTHIAAGQAYSGNSGTPAYLMTLNSTADFDIGNNKVGNTIVIPSAGLYDINLYANFIGDNPGGYGFRLWVNNVEVEQITGGVINPGTSDIATGRSILRFNAGDVITLRMAVNMVGTMYPQYGTTFTVLKLSN